MGDPVKIECPRLLQNGSVTNEYEPLHCADSNQPLQFPYGMDAVLQCVWSMDTAMYNMIRLSLDRKASYTCRVPMSKDASVFWPLTFSFWGLAEDEHTHIMTHWNFLLHALDGFFLGGSVYPLRDHWFQAQVGEPMMIHGPVRWFVGHTFESSVMEDWMATALSEMAGAEDDDDEDEDEAKEPPKLPPGVDVQGGAGGEAKKATKKKAAAMGAAGAADKKPAATPPPRPGIAPKSPVRPVTEKDLPSVAAILAAVPPSVVVTYVMGSVLITAALAALLYVSYLKPKLLETKKKK
ncbi:hypothetical protein DFJ73DRAFT_762169 [Zopfochytrium polystomum]|nr:hypothetical protein DFJ73DRAFT_762169 [Zopfochytrium polystomum]